MSFSFSLRPQLPLHTSHSALLYGCPRLPEQGADLTKVVDGQPEHVIGAHPSIINVLEDETLMESHNGVVIYLRSEAEHNGNVLTQHNDSVSSHPIMCQ